MTPCLSIFTARHWRLLKFRKEYVTRKNIVKSDEMPMERSADGLIKHIIREEMNTKECCLDLYMQFRESGKATGTSRHLSESRS